MKQRTEQDNNITLYSSDELTTMENILYSNSNSYVPFSLAEIKEEKNKRHIEWLKTLPKGKKWLSSNSDKPLFSVD